MLWLRTEADRYTFNMTKGATDSALEHAVVDHFLSGPSEDKRLTHSPMTVFLPGKDAVRRIAKGQPIPEA